MNRDFSKVSCRLFRSRKFRALQSNFERLVYVYLLVSPEGNAGGCFEQPAHVAIAELGCDEDAYLEAIDSLSEGLIAYDEATETVFIHNWFTFNEPTNTKHAAGAVTQIAKVPCRRLKIVALQELRGIVEERGLEWDGKQVRATLGKIDRLLEGYAEPITTKTLLDEEKDKTETERETRRASAPENPECPEDGACVMDAAPLPNEGGEEDGGKLEGPTPQLKALVARQARHGSGSVH
ncbi:MAG: hypothetical protein GY952_06680 [Rhodobacteraceae bacterium]|nr:hypothetical protein [Paracoccaceae bacterium]